VETPGFFLLFSAFGRLSIPSLLVCLYRALKLAGNESGGRLVDLSVSNSLSKCGVYCRYEGISGTKSLEWWSLWTLNN
jgi:hypothetical protein